MLLLNVMLNDCKVFPQLWQTLFRNFSTCLPFCFLMTDGLLLSGSLVRSEREFLYQILGEVIKAGATTLNIPDTVGITLPSEFGQLIADIKANTPGIENVIISTHCQNDLGLSTANTLAVCHCSFHCN